MPTYDYLCQGCEHRFEEFQSMTAEPLKTCPECGADQLKRLIGTGAGVIFKGSGFYETDYRSKEYQKAAEAEKGGGTDKSEAGKSESAKSDSSASDSGKAESGKSDSTTGKSAETGSSGGSGSGSGKSDSAGSSSSGASGSGS